MPAITIYVLMRTPNNEDALSELPENYTTAYVLRHRAY